MSPRRRVLALLLAFCLVSTCECAAVSPVDMPQTSPICSPVSPLENGFRTIDWSFWPSLRSGDSCTDRSLLDRSSSLVFGNTTLTSQKPASLLKTSTDYTPTRTIARRGEDNPRLNLRPTPQPTGDPRDSTAVHITSTDDFALLLPGMNRELISDAENDGISYCTSDTAEKSCADRPRLPVGFITAAAMKKSDDGSWIQVTGCLDNSKFHLDPSDAGGQFDVRFPNGAQCAYGGYGASFIELVEPSLSRFCIRCCSSPNDQTHCNSHQDRLGCTTAIPGRYDFPDIGVSCS